MGTAAKGKVLIEAGRVLVDYAALSDSGDHTRFKAADAIWSRAEGYEPMIKPDGILSGLDFVVPAASLTNDAVDISGLSANSLGVEHAVAASSDFPITRPSVNTHLITSIIMDSAGAFDTIEGTEGTEFSEVRDAAGGPPLIAVGSVEIAQVRLSAQATAPITADEILQVPGQHAEFANYPVFSMNAIGLGDNADNTSEKTAFVKFADPLPLIHTGGVAKAVYMKYYVPQFAQIPKATDFVPAELSHSATSESYYDGVEVSASESLGQASVTVLMDDGISDLVASLKNKLLATKYFPNKNKTPYQLTQGYIGLKRTNPVANSISGAMTITALTETADFLS